VADAVEQGGAVVVRGGLGLEGGHGVIVRCGCGGGRCGLDVRIEAEALMCDIELSLAEQRGRLTRRTDEGSLGMAKTIKVPTFDEVLKNLGNERFDVSPAANKAAGAYRVSKLGCAAEIAPSEDKGSPTRLLAKGGWVLGGEIARITDRGYQKFLKTSKLEIPATAEHLRAIHSFNEQLKEAVGAMSLYNESLGTTSDRYVYDRVKGRE